MSYRLIDSNAIAIKYPEVNEMPCVFANLPDGMNGQFIDAQPEPSIPLSWIDKQIERLKGMDNAFATLTAMQISGMVKKWSGEDRGGFVSTGTN